MRRRKSRSTREHVIFVRVCAALTAIGLFCAVIVTLLAFGLISAQPWHSESVRDELSRLQSAQGLTFAWLTQPASQWSAEKVLGVYFQERKVVSIADSLTSFRADNYEKVSSTTRLIGECWSHDRTKLATTFVEPLTGKVSAGILELESGKTTAIAINVDQRPFMTSQCWSKDDKSLVYAIDGAVRIYDLVNHRADAIAKGSDATWSPDGSWIAFRDEDVFYEIHADGTGQNELFRNGWGKAVSALYWSPDSRIVAYVRELGFLQGGALDAEVNQLRARRLADGSDESLCDDSVDWYADYQWIDSRELRNRARR